MSRLVDADKLMKLIPIEEYNARMAITYAPTVDAEPVRHGHWVSIGSMHRCSVCNEMVLVPTTIANKPIYEYCPVCGAKMDEK